MFTAKLGSKESFEKPSEILYADSPKALSSLQGIRKIDVTKVESMANFTWTETNVISKELSSEILMQGTREITTAKPAAFQRMVQQIKENSSKLVLTKMGKYGHGVFSCADIPANTFIASSTGTLTSIDSLISEQDSGAYSININNTVAINARNNGNIARFFQHLPSASSKSDDGTQLDFYTFTDASIKPKVAIQNIQLKQFLYKNQMVIFVMTTCPITKFDMLGWDYGPAYWKTLELTPVLFFKNGQNIDQSAYKMNYISVHVRYSDSAIAASMSLEYIEKQFQNKGEIVMAPDDEILVTVSQSMFRKKYNANPRSLFHFFDSPNKVIKPEQVKAELNRISAGLKLPNWEYEEVSAYLNSPNSEKLLLLGNHLQKSGCNIEYLQDNTQLMVHYPESDKLHKIEAMSDENQIMLQMG